MPPKPVGSRAKFFFIHLFFLDSESIAITRKTILQEASVPQQGSSLYNQIPASK